MFCLCLFFCCSFTEFYSFLRELQYLILLILSLFISSHNFKLFFKCTCVCEGGGALYMQINAKIMATVRLFFYPSLSLLPITAFYCSRSPNIIHLLLNLMTVSFSISSSPDDFTVFSTFLS